MTEIYQDESSQWRWRIKAKNGKIIADSAESYTTEAGAKRASKQVIAVPTEGVGEVSDGFHTFNELYSHRTELFILLMKQNYPKAWRAKVHEDGSMFEGYFIAGIHTPAGDISYHLEEKYWDSLNGMITLEKAEPFDGHTPEDVANRLSEWAKQL